MLYEALLKDTLELCSGLEGVHLAVAFSPPEALNYFRKITSPDIPLIPVEGENIGVCLEQSLGALLERGYQKALALNTDGPSLPRAYLMEAVRLLDEADLVLGPCEDGGYYLVGIKQLHSAIFDGIPWSTDQVLARTLAQAERLGLHTALTLSWYDVDSLADARRLLAEVDLFPAARLAHTRQFFCQYPLVERHC